jgi:hypothetical protein
VISSTSPRKNTFPVGWALCHSNVPSSGGGRSPLTTTVASTVPSKSSKPRVSEPKNLKLTSNYYTTKLNLFGRRNGLDKKQCNPIIAVAPGWLYGEHACTGRPDWCHHRSVSLKTHVNNSALIYSSGKLQCATKTKRNHRIYG